MGKPNIFSPSTSPLSFRGPSAWKNLPLQGRPAPCDPEEFPLQSVSNPAGSRPVPLSPPEPSCRHVHGLLCVLYVSQKIRAPIKLQARGETAQGGKRRRRRRMRRVRRRRSVKVRQEQERKKKTVGNRAGRTGNVTLYEAA